MLKKRTIAVAMILLVMAAAMAAGNIRAAAAAEESEWGTSPFEDGVEIIRYTPRQGVPEHLVIPDTLEGKPVYRIHYEAFMQMEYEALSTVKTVEIPSYLALPGENDSTFFWWVQFYFSHLENIVAKPDCAHFRTVDGVLFDAELHRLFAYPMNRKAQSYRVPEGTQTIESDAFYFPPILREIILPDSLVRIEKGALTGVTLDRLHIPANLESVAEDPMHDCRIMHMTSASGRFRVMNGFLIDTAAHRLIGFPDHGRPLPEGPVIPEGVEIIGKGAFEKSNDQNLDVVFPSTLKEIEDDNEFFFSEPIVILPEGLEIIGNDCSFGKAKKASGGLRCLVFPSTLQSIGYNFSNFYGKGDGPDTIVFREGIREIGTSAFWYVPRSPRTYILPASLEKIYEYCFQDTANQTAVVHAGSYAEAYCRNAGMRVVSADLFVRGTWSFTDREAAARILNFTPDAEAEPYLVITDSDITIVNGEKTVIPCRWDNRSAHFENGFINYTYMGDMLDLETAAGTVRLQKREGNAE